MKKHDPYMQPPEQPGVEAYGEYAQPGGEGAPIPPAPDARLRKETLKRRRTSWLFKFLVGLTCLAIALVVLQETVFRLNTVYVVGNTVKTAQQIVTASGLVSGRSIFSVNEEDVRKAIGRDHTIIFEDMRIVYPSTVYLYIRERTTTAVMSWLGILYTLDDDGVVMAQVSAANAPSDLPEVTGFRVGSVTVGKQLNPTSTRQMEAYQQIMLELYEQMYSDKIAQINLADPDNLFLETRSGITVRLGDAQHMMAKICALRTYMTYFRQLGDSSTGLLDVTTPEDAKFQSDT